MNTLTCAGCGASLAEGVRFCTVCGTPCTGDSTPPVSDTFSAEEPLSAPSRAAAATAAAPLSASVGSLSASTPPPTPQPGSPVGQTLLPDGLAGPASLSETCSGDKASSGDGSASDANSLALFQALIGGDRDALRAMGCSDEEIDQLLAVMGIEASD